MAGRRPRAAVGAESGVVYDDFNTAQSVGSSKAIDGPRSLQSSRWCAVIASSLVNANRHGGQHGLAPAAPLLTQAGRDI